MFKSLKQLMDDNKGELPAFAWPGGYPIMYLTKAGDALCADCATNELGEQREDGPTAYGIHWEGPSEWCSSCNVEIQSAYGDPADNQEEEESDPCE